MATDFIVIQSVRQRFGDESSIAEDVLVEKEAPLVGLSKDYDFACPNVASGEKAVLQFESLGVTAPLKIQPTRPRNIIRINGVDIPGGITSGGSQFWKTHSLIVPVNTLKEANNALHIESVILFQEHVVHFDDFIIDNVVLHYKTKPQVAVPGGEVA